MAIKYHSLNMDILIITDLKKYHTEKMVKTNYITIALKLIYIKNNNQMKKLFTIALLLIWGISNAQNYNQSWSTPDKMNYKFVTVGFDVRNLAVGSKPTEDKSELNYQIKVGAVSKNVEIGIFYEQFNRIQFQAYGAQAGYIFQLSNKTNLYAGAEYGSIIRYNDDNFLMYGFNGEIRQHVGNRLIIGLQCNYRYRSDIDQKNGANDFKASVMLNTTFKFN